ncbi:hypothetical protein D9757_000410 [Collybiopsis confluens]|uniref:Cyclin-domain-containing protein n=1 Tax=Collybiopsis confluens TaxID=2823264 RepID=A0A8H5MHK1_9AGAR|nr:hypothetical protein D9757_000410 [Collybiopsis confluens]
MLIPTAFVYPFLFSVSASLLLRFVEIPTQFLFVLGGQNDMLALVHPFNPSPDTPHRAPSSNRSRTPHHRKSTPTSRESSFSAASSYSSYIPPKSTSSFSMNGSVSSSRHTPQPTGTRQGSTTVTSLPSTTAAVPEAAAAAEESILPAASKQPQPAATTESSFDIHSYPPPDLLRLLASLLTQIASTNDKLEAGSSSNSPSSSSVIITEPHNPVWQSLTTASRSALSTHSSTLTFHARNVPTISLEAYLLRILKYCPTTNEVFLSLLVYFDRMTKLTSEATGRSFVIDSYNIHRLVIAGVTVASKFFSDVFYTNSRYAKVGGLPLAELNQLELQFLLLNNFNLVIPKDEMRRYAEQLILFSSVSPGSIPSLSASTSSSSITPRPTPTAPSRSSDAMAPMRSMGAIDAYGGRIHGGESHSSASLSSVSGSASMTRHGIESNGSALSRVINPDQHQPHHALNGTVNGKSFVPSSKLHYQEDSESETGEGAETETETEAETETDGGWTTDDEPTIRPTKSSAGSSSSSSDAQSICSFVSESDSGEGDDEREDHIMDDMDDDDDEGARTPEHVVRAEGVKDGEKTPERRPFRGRLGMSKVTTPTRRHSDENEEEMASP